MVKVLTAVLLILTAVKAGPNKPKAPIVQCRVQIVDIATDFSYTSDWLSCKSAEIISDDLFVSMDPGLIIWTEEQKKIKGKWSKPKLHTDPRIIPHDDFSKDRNNT